MYIFIKVKVCSCGVSYQSVQLDHAKFASQGSEEYKKYLFFNCASCRSTMIVKGDGYYQANMAVSN